MQTVKMVVTGPFNAGKTAFIQSVSEIDVVSTERKITAEAEKIKETTTVAMDFGRITVDDDLVLYLFGTPGQKRFDFMWEILSEGMLGFIVMVDSTRPETFREARSILETFRAYAPTPYVVAANKQDMTGCLGAGRYAPGAAPGPQDQAAALRGAQKRNRQDGLAGAALLHPGRNGNRRKLERKIGARGSFVIDHHGPGHSTLRSLWTRAAGHPAARLAGFLGSVAGNDDLSGPVLPHLRAGFLGLWRIGHANAIPTRCRILSAWWTSLWRRWAFSTAPLVGHCMGGTVSLSVAIQHPERVAKVVVIGSPIARFVAGPPAQIGRHTARSPGCCSPSFPLFRAVMRVASPFICRDPRFPDMMDRDLSKTTLESFLISIAIPAPHRSAPRPAQNPGAGDGHVRRP